MQDDDLPEWVRQHRREVGELLRAARIKRGMTQEELAALAGLDDIKRISRLENGHYNVGIDLVARLARSLEVPSSSLFPSRGW